MRSGQYLFVLVALALAGCAPSGGPGAASSGQTGSAAPARTLVTMTNVDVVLAESPLAAGSSSRTSRANVFFQANLTATDLANSVQTKWPGLAERLPQLDTDTWKVFPDGRMEVTWVLRPGLTWHDGAPLTADDFVFAFQILKVPEYVPSTEDRNRVDDVIALDPRTILVRWNSPFAKANSAVIQSPRPRHILGEAFAQQSPEQFASHPYWGDNNSYVGVGAYRLQRSEPGAFLEGSAFDNFARGRPQIDRIKILVVPDKNTSVANLLSGEVQMSFDYNLFFEQGVVLKREWAKNNGGTVNMVEDQVRWAAFQYREQYVNPRDILDLRVRKALAAAIDKQGFIDGILEGEGNTAQTLVPPSMPYYADVDRLIEKHPYDPNRAHQLFAEAGLVRGADGVYLTKAGERFSPELRATAGYERESAILSDAWRRVGVDVRERYASVAEDANGEFRSTFPAVYTAYQNLSFVFGRLATTGIGTPENRWSGTNRGGYSSPEFDRFYEVALTSLREADSIGGQIQLLHIANADLPLIPLYFSSQTAEAWSSALVPPPATDPPSRFGTWNIEQWKWR